MRVRGENVSSYEVEDLVSRHHEIRVCAAFPVPSEEGDEDDIVICCVPAAEAGLTVEDVNAWCQEHMPRYI